jgi:DNA gyrase subunit B
MATFVNTLSEWARVEVCRDGQRYAQEYRQGIPTGPVARLAGAPTGWGTTTIFRPDHTIFTVPPEYDYDVLDQRARELCYLTQGLTITVRDERPGQERAVTHCFPQGILTWVRLLNLEQMRQHYAPMHEPFHTDVTVGTNRIEVALQYNPRWVNWPTGRVLTFANNDVMAVGGTPLTGFYAGLLEAINTYAHAHDLLPATVGKLLLADVGEGLIAIVSVKLPNPVCHNSFGNQIDNPEIHEEVREVVTTGLSQFFADHPEDTHRLLKECVSSARARIARRKDARGTRRNRYHGRRS